MARPKGKLTLRQHLENKDYNLYRNFKDKKMFSLRDLLIMHDEWEEEKEKKSKNKKKG